jgi:hypothetical protein
VLQLLLQEKLRLLFPTSDCPSWPLPPGSRQFSAGAHNWTLEWGVYCCSLWAAKSQAQGEHYQGGYCGCRAARVRAGAVPVKPVGTNPLIPQFPEAPPHHTPWARLSCPQNAILMPPWNSVYFFVHLLMDSCRLPGTADSSGPEGRIPFAMSPGAGSPAPLPQ